MRKTLIAALALLSLSAFAADDSFKLVIRDHRFEPTELHVPAQKKIKLVIHNQDKTPEEFESHELHREKVIAPGATVTIRLGPLKPGRYPFVGEFHEDTARGVLIVE